MELGSLFVAQRSFAEGERVLREALGILSAQQGTEVWTAATQRELAGALTEQGNFEEAESLLLKAHEFFRTRKNAPRGRLESALQGLVRLYEAWGKPEESARWQVLLDAGGK